MIKRIKRKKILLIASIFVMSFFFSIAYASTTAFYLYNNPSGSITSIIDSAEVIINTYEYEDFEGKQRLISEKKLL